MKDKMLYQATEYLHKHQRMKRWQKIMICLASVVVFCTTYALIIPAITMVNGPTCGIDEHNHTDECYAVVKEVQCELEEHTHDEACQDTEGNWICEFGESGEHTHEDDCYTTVKGDLICKKEEHSHHDRLCYIDKTVDLEDENDWEKTLPKELSGIWKKDFPAIAESQIDYAESFYNIEVDEDGTIHPYTRYGAWHEDPYGEWNGMFIEFCLHYAGVEETDFPRKADMKEWVTSLEEKTLYITAEKNPIPEAGQIAFLDTDADGKADRAAIVKNFIPEELKEKVEESTPAQLVVIEGDTDKGCVEELTYEFPLSQILESEKEEVAKEEDVTTILGYGILPEQEFICGMEEHVHVDTCYDETEVLTCNKEEHEHNKDCLPVEEDKTETTTDGVTTEVEATTEAATEGSTEEVTTEVEGTTEQTTEEPVITLGETGEVETIQTPEYYCCTMAHSHVANCYDESNSLICGFAEHVHTAECQVNPHPEYYCGFVEEHVHSGCYTNFKHTCGKIGHTHYYLCETAPQYCEVTAHQHTAACRNENNTLICGKSEHVHMPACWINPKPIEGGTDAEGSIEGETQFHSNHFHRYQAGSHTVSSYETGVFLLIPDSKYSESWIPNTRVWSGDSGANYMVAYCTDDRTTSSKNGEHYDTYTLDNSRFSNDELQRKVAAIIGNSYPFLTVEEMKATLKAAYEAGLTVDSNGKLIDVTDSVEADWIGATQWAIWNTTTTMTAHATSKFDIDDYNNDRPAAFPTQSEYSSINPLTNPGYTDVATSRQKAEAIKNWLCSLSEPVALEVLNHSYEMNNNTDGTTNLNVTVKLNRIIESGENVEFQLSVGNRATKLETLPVGKDTFTMTIENLTDKEIASATVNLTLDGKHMQAYFFDSQNYQDMVSGNWEYYEDDLSFDVFKEINVSVHKKWQDSNVNKIPYVTVQLYADGKAQGEPVQLNDQNGWTYVWENLRKYSAVDAATDTYTEINYTVTEVPVNGYYADVTKANGDYTNDITYTMWELVDTFTGDGEYIFMSDYGALTISDFKDRYYMNLSSVDTTIIDNSQTASVWNAKYDSASDGYKIESKLYPGAYMNADSDAIVSNGTSYTFVNNHLKSGSLYFRSFYSNGYQVYTTDESLAMDFKLYKLTTHKVPSEDVNLVITNIPYGDAPDTDVAVTKKWTGRKDGQYPTEAYVQLLQNDLPYGEKVKLSAENNWTYTWTQLKSSVVDSNGTEIPIEYEIEEIDIPEGYNPTITKADNTYSYVLTNTWIPKEAEVTLLKADLVTKTKYLSNAQFDLYIVNNGITDQIPNTEATGTKVTTVVTDNDGKASFKVSLGETYYLVEAKAPEGYNLLTSAVSFKVNYEGKMEWLEGDMADVSANDCIVTVYNQGGYVLPETGSTGTHQYTLAGLAILLLAGCLLYKKRREEGRAL